MEPTSPLTLVPLDGSPAPSLDGGLARALRYEAAYYEAAFDRPGLHLRDAVLDAASRTREPAYHPGIRAALVLTALDRYGVPYARILSEEWCVVAGPFAVHLDALTACRVEPDEDGALVAVGTPHGVTHDKQKDEQIQARAWALHLALEMAGAGDRVDAKETIVARLSYTHDDIARLEAELDAARRRPSMGAPSSGAPSSSASNAAPTRTA